MQQLDPSLASQLKGTGPGGMPTQADAAQAQTKQAEAESQRQDILTKVMAPDAKERLARISLVKPDKVPTLPPHRAPLASGDALTSHSRSRRATGPQAGGDGDDDGAAWAAARAAFGRAAQADARADWRRGGANERPPPGSPPCCPAVSARACVLRGRDRERLKSSMIGDASLTTTTATLIWMACERQVRAASWCFPRVRAMHERRRVCIRLLL